MDFSRAFVDLSRHCGLAFQDHPIVRRQRMRDYPREHFDNVRVLNGIFQDLKENQCIVVIVVLPKKPSPFYAQVKQAAELSSNRVGILTQCILAQNFKPKPPKRMDNRSSTVQQLLLKVNSKLNGVNHYVTIPPPLTSNFDRINVSKEPIMFLGADVTHPPPGTSVRDPNNPREQISPPSFAAVTASIDPTAMPYMMHVQAQRKEQRGAAEVVQGLDDIVAEFLKVFLGKNTILPTKIIYFRDGVGDGQFTELLDVEMRAIRNACMRFDAANHGKPYQPKITFITVQKRHKTRFFFKTDRGTDNAPPGTVVDTEIVHPTETDFFLLSHQAIQGTSRPTRYHLLWDDSDFTQDEIQTLTYYMCHMYVRCNRSVKIPAPTYYAHWAAARAKCLAEGQPIDLDLVSLNNIIQREANFKNAFPMHFI
jgi:eukaryotic translation initiation factor 2C